MGKTDKKPGSPLRPPRRGPGSLQKAEEGKAEITAACPADFRSWLERHHADHDAVVVTLFKVGRGTPSITWPQAIEEALCFGWIDGVRYPTGPDTYTVRFTPRRKGSKWSQVNVASARRLIAEGRMAPAGLAAFEARVEGPPRAYDPKAELSGLPSEQAAQWTPLAKAFFDRQAPSWRHKIQWWIAQAKTVQTRERRMARLVEACEAGRKLM